MQHLGEAAFLSDEHQIFRQQMRRWVARHLSPHADRWEAEGGFPRDVYRQVAEAGWLGVGFPEAYGGSGGDWLHRIVMTEELTRSGSPGLAASLGTLGIAAPPILLAGTEAQKQRFLPQILAGDKIAALAITEPDTGSDVAAIATRALRQGDHYVVRGAKTFITSGTRADLLTTLVRTGEPGMGGLSFLVIEADRPGVRRGRNLQKMGWHASDTAELFFDDVEVPVENRLGPENGGFLVAMQNFAGERLLLAAQAIAISEMAYEAARTYARERHAFGRPLEGFQVLRHRLVEMAQRLDLCRTYVYALASRLEAGESRVAEVAMAKNACTDMLAYVTDQALQIHGGFGYMREALVERLYRDARIYPIGGGTREVLAELAYKQLER